MALAAVLALIAGPGSSYASQIRTSGSTFQYRKAEIGMPAIAGDSSIGGHPAGKERRIKLETWINPWGGGEQDFIQTKGPNTSVGCNLPELLATFISNGNGACYVPSPSKRTLYDRRIAPQFRDAGLQPFKYSYAGYGVDNLHNEASVERAVKRAADHIRGEISSPGVAGKTWARFEAIRQLMSSPLSSRSTRQILALLLSQLPGYGIEHGANDPRGRRAELVTVPDQSHAGVVTLANDQIYDLSDAVLTQELYFRPRSFDVLAAQTVLDSTSGPELTPWLSENGGSGVLVSWTFDRVQTVRDKRYRQVLRPCDTEPDGLCLDIGPKGGPR